MGDGPSDGPNDGPVSHVSSATDGGPPKAPPGLAAALLDALAASDAVALAVMDDKGRYVWLSPAAAVRQGRDPAHVQGRSLAEVIGSENVTPELLRSLELGAHGVVTSQVRLGDGRSRLLIAFPVSVERPDGSQRAVATFGARLPRSTDRLLAGQVHREALLTDAAELGVWEWDRTSDRVVWNQWHERLFGYEPGTADRAFADWSARVHPDDLERTSAQLAAATQDGRLFESSYRVVLPSGEVRHLEGRGQLDPTDPSFMVGVVYDVTERERAAAREAELQREALQASDVERDRIAADIHDGPLQALSAAWLRLNTLASRLDGPPAGDERGAADERGARDGGRGELAGLAREIAGSLARTNQELRDVLGRLRSLPVDSSIDTFVHHVTDLGEELAERDGFDFQMRFDPAGLTTVPGPALGTLYRIVAEAVLNAANHARPSTVVADVRVAGDRLVAVVSDDGVGFDTSAGGPAGHFGLSIMRQRAMGLKGTTAIRSSPATGTTVTVDLPIGVGTLDPFGRSNDDQTG